MPFIFQTFGIYYNLYISCLPYFKDMGDSLNELLGPSNYLIVLEMFLENPGQWMNLREIARRVNKNPGSISQVVKNLLKRGLIIDCKVGLVSAVYQLNNNDKKVQALLSFRNALKK